MTQYSYSYQPLPPARRPRWPWAVLAVAVAFLASGVWFAYEYRIKKDSGVAACEAMRDRTAAPDTTTDLTEIRYRQLRKVFEDSRYDDLEAAGTRLIDVLWQVTRLGPNPGLAALPYVAPMMAAVTEVQGACARHGVVLKLDLAGGVASKVTAKRPECADVFRGGRIIDQAKASAGCSDKRGATATVADFPCSDGTHLFSVTGVPGVDDGWGWGGQQYRATGRSADDPAYATAMSRCFP